MTLLVALLIWAAISTTMCGGLSKVIERKEK